MRLANCVWMPRVSRRSRGRALRMAAAALIAAALANMPSKAEAAPLNAKDWAPGNPALPGVYSGASLSYGGAMLDLDGDGVSDVRLTSSFVSTGYGGYYTFALEPLMNGGVSNLIFAESPPVGKPVGGPKAQAAHGTAGIRAANGAVEVSCEPARRFDNADDIPTATGEMDGPGCAADLSNFSTAAYVGVLFNVPPSTSRARHLDSTDNEVGFLFISTDVSSLKIDGIGIQPYSVISAVKVNTWGGLRKIYR